MLITLLKMLIKPGLLFCTAIITLFCRKAISFTSEYIVEYGNICACICNPYIHGFAGGMACPHKKQYAK